MKLKKLYSISILCAILFYDVTHSRSPFRLPDPLMPTLEVCWRDTEDAKNNTYCLMNPHLEEYPIFGIFDETYFNQHLLPKQAITFRNNPDQSVLGEHLYTLIEEVVAEILAKQRTYTHFTVLQTKDFSRRGSCGLIVLKFNDYPFVVKIFLETPQSFSKPTGKGIEQTFFFYMGGGVNRHLTGFTRLRNLELIRDKIAHNPPAIGNLTIDTPRKWFWLPKNSSWLHITGYGFGNKDKQTIDIPGIYAIIADEIKPEKKLTLMDRNDRKLALRIYNFLESSIDPHIKNFMIEEGTQKLVIIDTEYFPILVGFKDTQSFDSYLAWFWHLIDKCAKDMFWLTKSQRHKRQTTKRNALLG